MASTLDVVKYPLESRTLGWDKETKQFHLKHPHEETIDMLAMEGTTFFEAADGKKGHLRMLNEVLLQSDGATGIRLPDFQTFVPESVSIGALYNEWWQCCFQRSGERFRIWPKGKGSREDTIYFNDIMGPAYVQWLDRGGHIFIHGRVLPVETRPGWTVLYVYGDMPSDS